MGNPHAALAIIGDSPDTADQGWTVTQLLKECGIDPEACWITQVSRWPVPRAPSRTFTERARAVGIDLQREMDRLRDELDTVRPNMIVALGKETCWTLTGKRDLESWRGSLVQTWNQRKCLSTYHPLRLVLERHEDGWKRQILKLDLKRGIEESRTPELHVPRRILAVARHAADVQSFLADTRTDRLALDIEAQNGVPICLGLATSPTHGLTVPLWDLPDPARVWYSLAHALRDPTIRKIGQNFKYDEPKLAGLGLAIDRLDSDTMLQAWCLQPELPCNLAFLTSVYTREPFYKDERMYEGPRHALYEGCARDACVTCEVEEAQETDIREMGLEPYYRGFVMPQHACYVDLEAEGFLVDWARRDLLLGKLIEEEARLTFDLRRLIGGGDLNVESWQQVRALLNRQLQVPIRDGTSEEVLAVVTGNVVKDPYRQSICAHIVALRRLHRTLRDQVEALPDDDGAVHTTYYLCTPDGRSRTGPQAPPIRPAVAVGARTKAVGVDLQHLTPEVRAIYQPPAGQCFLQLTFDHPVRRVVDHLAGIPSEDDETVAAWVFGGDPLEYATSDWCIVARLVREAFHRALGKRQTVETVNTSLQRQLRLPRISERQVTEAFGLLQQHQPQIRGVFHATVLDCLNTTRQLRTPLGSLRTFFGRWGPELLREAFNYLPTRTVSEHTQATGLRIRTLYPWLRVCLENFDALLVRCPVERHDKACQILRAAGDVAIDFHSCSLVRSPLSIPCQVTDGWS